jgi:hypothetical protein
MWGGAVCVPLRQAKHTEKTYEPVKTLQLSRWQCLHQASQPSHSRRVPARPGRGSLTQGRILPAHVWCRQGLFYLSSLGVVLFLFMLIAVSGPHLVHHALDRSPPQTQPSHAGDTPHDHSHDAPVPRPPDCLVLLLIRHHPVTLDGLPSFLPMLSLGEPIIAEATLQPPITPPPGFHARAPPVEPFHMLPSY